MNQEGSQYIDPSRRSLYGKEGGQFWIGKIVAYADQEEQLDDGFGWRYKVRILGDNSDTDQIEDSYLSYATVLLPTTAGTGAAFKLRSVRLSQGDMVFGVRGGGTAAPKFIIGALPRTRKTTNSSGKFGTLKGFYGSLNGNTKILDGEYNEQIGPKTPDVSPIGPKEYSKAERKDPSEKIEKFGINKDQKEDITEEQTEKLDVKKTSETKEWNPTKEEINDSSKRNTPKDSIVTSQIKNLLTYVDDNKIQSIINKINPLKTKEKKTARVYEREYSNHVISAIKQGTKQNLLDKDVAEAAINAIRRDDYERASLIIFPPGPPTTG